MSYCTLIGEGEFSIKKYRPRKISGQWSVGLGHSRFENPDSDFLVEKGFFQLRKNRIFTLSLDNNDRKLPRKSNHVISKMKLSKKDYKQMRKADNGSILFEYANWELSLDSCTSNDFCWGQEFSYHLSSDKFIISGTIMDDLGHQLFNDFL